MSYIDWAEWDAQWPDAYAPAYTYASARGWDSYMIRQELKNSIAKREEYRREHDRWCLGDPGCQTQKHLFEACMRLNNIITILTALRMCA